jgi:hypothetical protein
MKNAWKSLGAACVLVLGVYVYAAHLGQFVTASLGDPAGSYYNLLVQGFRAGQLNLEKVAPPQLAHLADPYDPAAHARYPVLDMSYYKGKLYLYFGVTPAVVLFWPYAALTDDYLREDNATVVFCFVGFVAGVGLLCALWRRYFVEVSVWVVAACALALGLATAVPVLLSRCEVYEVPISCGYMLTMLALGAIWCALDQPEPRKRSGWLAAASLAYGLAVGARPSLLFGAVILLVPVAQAWRERRPIGAPLIAATVPITLIAVGLMLYNARRFDSPFEFGMRYQLVGQRQVTTQLFSPRYLWFNFRVYFLEPMRWSGRFPFVHDIAVPPLPAGHLTVEAAFGVLTNIPLVWLALAVPLTWRGRSDQERGALRWFVAAVCLLFGICAVTLGFYRSAATRYEVEFLPALVLLAVLGILGVERMLAPTLASNRIRGQEPGRAARPVWRPAVRLGWGLLLVFSVAVNLFTSAVRCADTCNHLGVALENMGKVKEAMVCFDRALRFKPDYAEAYCNLGTALERAGRLHAAIGDYEQALRLSPNLPLALNNLAWLLATLPPAEGGDPARAPALAQHACELTNDKNAAYVDTLAAAYAAAGRFDEAIATARKAIDLAHADGQTTLVGEMEARLQLYRDGHVYHIKPSKDPAAQ